MSSFLDWRPHQHMLKTGSMTPGFSLQKMYLLKNQRQQPAEAIMASAAGDGGSQPSPVVETNKTIKRKKSLEIAKEAKIRGFEKYIEDEEPSATTAESCHNMAASHNVPHPEERLRFWSDPDTEFKLAKDTGIRVFRMGVDLTRFLPKEPWSMD